MTVARFILRVWGWLMVGVALAAVAAAQGPLAGGLPDAPGAIFGQGVTAGSVRGRVTDSNGVPVAEAQVTLVEEGGKTEAVTASGVDGGFVFEGVGAGRFRVSVVAAGFAKGSAAGVVGRGEAVEVAAVVLRTAETTTDVQVTATREEVGAAQVAQAETQRVLGVFPNFYVAYDWDAVPMTTRQKFGMAWKTTVDPVSLGLTGAVAGIEQAQNDFSGFGQGAAGYGKRFGAGFADGAISTFLSGAVLPTVFRQDPRYFYKGTGTVKGRAWYAVTSAVICRGDGGQRREVNYSAVLGNLATGAISNLYYPAANRNGAGLTFENGLLGTAGEAVGNLIEEFVLRKVTPRVAGSGKP